MNLIIIPIFTHILITMILGGFFRIGGGHLTAGGSIIMVIMVDDHKTANTKKRNGV
jgi:hypothetical protein